MTSILSALGAATLMIAASAQSQSARSLVREGNDHYEAGHFTDAEVNYRKALEKNQHMVEGYFNLGDALHRQGKYGDAVSSYEEAITTSESDEGKASAYYNIGNSLMREQKYQEAIQSYVDALKLNPGDQDAKFNLSYALKKLQQQQQDKNQQQNKDQKQDQNQQQRQQENKQDQQKQDQQQSRPQQPQRSISKSEAQRILEVLKNNERDIQKKLRARQAVRPKSDKDW